MTAIAAKFPCLGCRTNLRARPKLAGKKVRCPRCGNLVLVPEGRPGVSLPAAIVLGAAVIACSVYANLSFAVKDRADYRFFPPFQRNLNRNGNDHLGGEYFNMARALAAGEGFAHPFDRPTGPTAWQPPLLPAILAGLLWVSDGDRYFVMTVVVFLQVCVLIGTGVLVLALVRQTTTRIGPYVATAVFLGGLVSHFWLCFQYTHDGWLVLLALNLLIAGLCWWRPLRGWKTAAGWGLLGGVCAQINPGIGMAWGLLSLPAAWRGRAWSRLAVAVLVAGLTLAPWTVRNWLVFGRLVPMKANFFYELYQSHCLQKEGQLQGRTFRFHPYGSANPERQEYNRLGEAAFMDRKRQQFWEAVRADPLDYPDRVAHRFLNAAVWYEPFRREEPTRRPWVFWASRLIHPLPFVALLVLVLTGIRRPLHAAQVAVIGAYFLYLLPYVAASYYERYALPLVGVKVLLVLWGADRLLSVWRGAVQSRGGQSPTEKRAVQERFRGGAGSIR